MANDCASVTRGGIPGCSFVADTLGAGVPYAGYGSDDDALGIGVGVAAGAGNARAEATGTLRTASAANAVATTRNRYGITVSLGDLR